MNYHHFSADDFNSTSIVEKTDAANNKATLFAVKSSSAAISLGQAQHHYELITQAALDLNPTHSIELPIEIDTCFDFGTLFCRVFYGMKLLGNFWRRDNYWLSEPFYQNPQREHLVHTDSSEAITFIFDCYLGKQSCCPVAQPKKEYAVILETIETDEYGAPFESQVIVEWDADVPIDWNSWLAWYEYEHCAEFRLVSIQPLLEPEEF